jgi:asparagine synthase (glutamine-hydrolysing)
MDLESVRIAGEEDCIAAGFAGDFLLSFNGSGAMIPSRSTSKRAQVLDGESSTILTFDPPTNDWRGFPVITASMGEYQAWLIGEIFGLSKNQTRQQMLRRVISSETFAEELNGHFLLLVQDHYRNQWHVWTNRFGTVHAYYCTDGQKAAVGTFSPSVAAVASKRRLDWVGLTGFFGFGFFPQDRTHFEDVRILPPATHSTFDDQGKLLTQRRYWQWWHKPNEARSYDETVNDFADVFSEVMADHLEDGRIALPISGGLDSRSTVAAIDSRDQSSSKNRFWAYSYGYSKDGVETSIAAKVAAARHLPIETFEIKPYLFEKLDTVCASVEAFQDVTQCRQAAICEELARRADYLVAAHWGDIWLNDMGLVSPSPQGLENERVVGHLLQGTKKGGRQWLLDHLCSSRLDGEQPDAVLKQVTSDEVSRLGQLEDADFKAKAFKTDQWSFRWTTASLRMFQPGAFPRLPFYDSRMADFFCSVPSQFVVGRKLQVDYLKRFAPDLARIPWQAFDTNLFRYQYFGSLLLPKRALKKSWRILTRQHVIERNWEVQFLNSTGREGLAHWLLRLGLRLHEFVAPKAIRNLLDAFYQAPFEQKRGYTVSMLLTFSIWLERYG